MLRALLVILAILSVVLGVALGLWFMYVVAALLLVAAAGVWMLSLKGKFEIGRPDSRGFQPVEEEGLGALGILEIRPKQAAVRQEASKASEPVGEYAVSRGKDRTEDSSQQYTTFESEEKMSTADTEIHRHPPVEQNGKTDFDAPPPRSSAPPSGPRARDRRSSSNYQVVSSSGSVDRDVILPCLESLCAAIEANTVCLLGSEANGKGHRIHAIVSRNAYARSGGELTPGNGMRWSSSRYVTVERAADATWDPYDLQYYRETIAVKELAHVAVPAPADGGRFLLVADSMQDGVLSEARVGRVIEQYSTLLGVLIARGEEAREEASPALRPRREIIAEEMQQVRSSDSPLALALVMLNRAEEISQARPKLIDEMEEVLRDRLEQSADSLRVERFGDLMFGVFVWSPVSEVEAWALEVQEELDSLGGDFAGGVSIGAAMLAERHSTPEQLRADAAAALQEAVKSKVCTILD